MKKILISLCVSLCLVSFQARSEDKSKICMILDKAGKDDHGFNQSAYEAFQASLKKKMISLDSKVFEAKDEARMQQAVRTFVEQKCVAIFVVGFNNAELVQVLAPKYPAQNFVVIDAVVNAKNVRSLVYREDQGAFLVGAIAGMKSKSNKVGFIGGMEVPLIKRFETAYVAGAQYANPKVEILKGYVGVTIDAWNNPTKAQEIALSQYEHGADVIFHAAGGSGFGVFNAVEKVDANQKVGFQKFAIGCDTNQNWIKPGLVLTSMVKEIKKSTQDSIQDVVDHKFTAGVMEYGLSNSGVDWAFDKNNEKLFTKTDLKEINRIKTEIISGKIHVPDYYKSIQK